MASSSRPFQSQTFSRLVAGYWQLAHGAERWLRQGRTALLWGVQVALFPVYVAFQSLRVVSRRFQVAQPWQSFKALLTGVREQPMMLGSDSPIRALLSIVQPQTVRQPGRLQAVDSHGPLLRQSRAESVLTPGQWQRLALSAPVRGVASDLATRQLVLVTSGNQIFDGLTDAQRQRLHRAIVLLLAEYRAWCRRQGLARQLGGSSLSLPQAEATQWPLVQWLNRAMGWIQTSPLAIAANLFGEAQPSLPPPSTQGDALADWFSPSFRRFLSSFGSRGQEMVPAGSGQPMLSHDAWAGPLAPLPLAPTAVMATAVTAPSPPYAWVGPLEPVQDASTTVTAGSWAGSVDSVVPTRRPLSLASEPATAVKPSTQVLPIGDAIDTQVTLVNYIDHPLVVVLRWLDALLHTLETWLRSLWQWLWVHL